MIGIIYYISQKRGLDEFKKIVSNYEKQGILPLPLGLHLSQYNSYVKFENGDIWKTVRCGDGARGHRWNVAYIEHTIPKEEREQLIYPYGLNYIWCATNEFY